MSAAYFTRAAASTSMHCQRTPTASTSAARPNSPTTIFPARAIIRCSTTTSAPGSAPCTQPRRSRRAGSARRWSRATSRRCWRPHSPSSRATGSRWSIAGAADSAAARVAHVLNEVGWRAVQLDGGYRAYRRHVVARLAVQPARYRFKVVCALTGSGKSQLLGALADAGAQTLDLEGIAQHRGSLLGQVPGHAATVAEEIRNRSPGRTWPPRPAASGLRRGREPADRRDPAARCVAPAHARAARRSSCARRCWKRIALLKSEYRHFLQSPALLLDRLRPLVELHGKAAFARWETLAASGDWDALIGELLESHYDPLYGRSMARHFPAVGPSAVFGLRDPSPRGLCRVGRRCACRKRRLQDRR